MTRVVDLQREAVLAAQVPVVFSTRNSGKIPTQGQFHWTLTTMSTGVGVVVLKGTNNPDPSDTSGETLITNTHGAGNQQDGSAANKGYKYVFVLPDGNFANISKVYLHGTGFAGIA